MPASEAYGDPKYNGILDSCGGHTGPSAEYHDHYINAAGSCGLLPSSSVRNCVSSAFIIISH